MNRPTFLLSLSLLCGASAALAKEPVDLQETDVVVTTADANGAVLDALEQAAELPRTPPTLPDQASDRARDVHQTIAFGKKGEQMREAHARSGDQARTDAADSARDEARARGLERAREASTRSNGHANRGLDQATTAHGNADTARAAGRARAEAARGNATNPPRPNGAR